MALSRLLFGVCDGIGRIARSRLLFLLAHAPVVASRLLNVFARGQSDMQMTIFLDVEEANFLRDMIPESSPARAAIVRAIHTRDYWGAEGRDVVVDCDDDEGLELLAYAESYCDSAADKIRRSFRLAHLRVRDYNAESQRSR